jgi:uncharacterized DUF497 family protein
MRYNDSVVIAAFDWDDGNVFHIGRHEITPEEAEEVFDGRYKAGPSEAICRLRRNLDGRLLFVVFRRLTAGMIRVVTARDMDDRDRRVFRRK